MSTLEIVLACITINAFIGFICLLGLIGKGNATLSFYNITSFLLLGIVPLLVIVQIWIGNSTLRNKQGELRWYHRELKLTKGK